MVTHSRHREPDGPPDFEIPLLRDFARARRTDPSTSGEAAHRMNRSGAAAAHVQKILDALAERNGQTGKEIAVATGLTQVQVMRRTKAMEDEGLLLRGTDDLKRDGQLTWWLPAKRSA